MQLGRLFYLARYYLVSKFSQRKQPILAGVKLTHRCSLRCRQCPYWRRPGPELSWRQLQNLFPFLRQEGIRLVILEGGEPTLWRDGKKTLADVIELAKKYFYTVGVTTNGLQPLIYPANIYWVSIDGLPDTHDCWRGKSFDKIMHNLKTACSRVLANITIHRYNVREIPELVKLLAGKVQGITIQFFYPYPESEDMLCSWEERRWVLTELQNLKQAGYPVADSLAALEALKDNRWQCESWMIANVDPDGTYRQGCYLLNRTSGPSCALCGFAAHTEISLAYQLNWQALGAGREILGIF